MTLACAELDLARCFDDGMAYVALSRVVSLQCTRILSFDARKVTANAKVAAFYRELDARCPPKVPQASSSQGSSQGSSGSQGGGSGLTQEQRERMAANLAAAKARALAKRTQSTAPANLPTLSAAPTPALVPSFSQQPLDQLPSQPEPIRLPTAPPSAAAMPAVYRCAANQPDCPYGVRCYRKNPSHFEEANHPADHPLIAQGRPAQ